MSAGGRPVGKVTVSRMKPLTSRSQSELSGNNYALLLLAMIVTRFYFDELAELVI